VSQVVYIPQKEVGCIYYHIPRAFAIAAVHPHLFGDSSFLDNPDPLPPWSGEKPLKRDKFFFGFPR
jgi:hypothetical protein